VSVLVSVPLVEVSWSVPLVEVSWSVPLVEVSWSVPLVEVSWSVPLVEPSPWVSALGLLPPPSGRQALRSAAATHRQRMDSKRRELLRGWLEVVIIGIFVVILFK
jgi:hypothetical protein